MDKYQSRFTGVEIDARLAKVNQEFTLEEKEKLSGLVNYDDTEVWEALGTRVEKVEGKGLSSNDFTDDDKSKLNGLHNYDDTAITQAVEELQTSKANADDVYNKDETYNKDEIINQIITKVAEIVAGAPENFDTLKELADWIDSHEDSAAAMNTAIKQNATDIANRYTKTESDNKYLGKTATAAAAALDGAGGNIAEQFKQTRKTIKINQRTLGTQATKNVLKTKKISQTMNGITAITNDDGSIRVTGTATHPTYFNLYSDFTVPESANYVLSGCPSGGGTTHYQLYLTGGTAMYDSGIGATGYIEASHKMSVYIFIAENKTVDLMFYPMLRYADITDDTYEPYVPSLQEQINALMAEIAELKTQITTE